MSFIEKMFGGPRRVEEELEPNPSGIAQDTVVEKKEPKTLDDIRTAKDNVRDLENKREDILQKHRDTAQELRAMGVNEYSPDTAPRTETVNDILNPIEEELVAISKEINDTREKFDLQPNREQVIQTRLFRLGNLKQRLEKEFEKTPSGLQIKYWEEQYKEYYQQSDLHVQEMKDIIAKEADFFRDDKVANAYAKTRERIDGMVIDLNNTLSKAKTTGFDDNGQNRI